MEENNNNNKNYFGIFQIGPVQDFIKTSRKTKDFWASSYILSKLISIAIDKIGSDYLVYPSNQKYKELKKLLYDKKISVFPNRFVVIYNNQEKLEDKFKEAEEEVKNNFKNLIINDFDNLKKIKINGKNLFNNLDTLFDRQISNFLEIYWIIAPFNENNYSYSYRYAETIFNGRKSIRNFNYFEENGFKCTLCGERETISNNPLDRSAIKNEWNKIREDSNFKFLFKKNEHLCFVCFLKRLYEKNYGFPSTSVFAASNFIKKLIENNESVKVILSKFQKYINSIKDFLLNFLNEPIEGNMLPKILKDSKKLDDDIKDIFNLEGEMFYIETYDNFLTEIKKDNNINNDSKKNIENSINNIKDSLKDIYEQIKTVSSKYFAVIQYDGDDIGKKLSEKESINEHRDFSEYISSFTEKVLDLENYYLCKVVYAGGDEGLIFSSISDALDLIIKLDELFKTLNLTLTFSLVIAHYTHPLRNIIETSRELLKEAKNYSYLKNSIGITILKRSGEKIKLIFNMKFNEDIRIKYFKDIVDIYKKGYISKRWWRNLINYKDSFQYEDRGDLILDKELLKLEVKRLINRKLKLKSSNINDLIEKFIDTLPAQISLKENKELIEIFLNSMSICEFLSRED